MVCSDIDRAKNLLLTGNVVAIPTETVYGLAGNAYDEKVIARIFEIKQRPWFDPLIVHTDSLDKVKLFVEHLPIEAQMVAKLFWPGPLTLLLPKKNIIPDLVTAGSPYVGVRIPNHPICLQLLSRLPFPLAAPSANPFGYVSPTKPQHVADQLGDKIPMILDGAPCSIGIESTIISFESQIPKIRRLGGLDKAVLEKAIGPMEMDLQHAPNTSHTPGALLSHYAPQKKMLLGNLLELIAEYNNSATLGVLSFQKKYPAVPNDHQVVLSPSGCLKEAARNLFHGLRLLDSLPIDLILADYLPNRGIGEAINDRLQRAQYREKITYS